MNPMPNFADLCRVFALAAVIFAFVGGGAMAAPDVPVAELMKPAELPDIAIGNADAPVTVVEYSSLTCPHCAAFQAKVFPAFKVKYVDTGKVRFVSREFPLDALAAAGSMLARCIDKDKAFAFIETLFATQSQWAGGTDQKAKLFEVAKQAGFTQASFEVCLTDQVLLDKIQGIAKRADEAFGIEGTPSFFANGKRVEQKPGREYELADFDGVIAPLLAVK